MCCCCGLRGTTICASLFTLVQSLIGIAFSTFIIINHGTCIKWLQTDNTFYYFYFYRAECFSPGADIVDAQFNFVDRTLVWGKVYAVLNGSWLLSSFLMAVCSCVRNTRKSATYVLYGPWIVVTVAIIVTDLAATIIHFSDLTSIQDLLVETADSTRWWKILVGPLAMGLIFSRFVVGWIINFGMLICVSILVVRLWREPTIPKMLSTAPPGGLRDNRNAPGAPPLEDVDWHPGYVPHIVESEKPRRDTGNGVDLNANARPAGRDQLDDDNYSGGYYKGANVKSIISQQPRIIVPDPRYTEAHKNREEGKLSKSPKGYIPGGPNLHNDEKDERGAGKQRAGYPTAVRNQLPWSYFQNPADASRPIPRQPGAEDDADRPPVPVPDYTLHIGKRPRHSRSSSDASSIKDAAAGRQPRNGQPSREADVLY